VQRGGWGKRGARGKGRDTDGGKRKRKREGRNGPLNRFCCEAGLGSYGRAMGGLFTAWMRLLLEARQGGHGIVG
jgi:hypothetical protein